MTSNGTRSNGDLHIHVHTHFKQHWPTTHNTNKPNKQTTNTGMCCLSDASPACSACAIPQQTDAQTSCPQTPDAAVALHHAQPHHALPLALELSPRPIGHPKRLMHLMSPATPAGWWWRTTWQRGDRVIPVRCAASSAAAAALSPPVSWLRR